MPTRANWFTLSEEQHAELARCVNSPGWRIIRRSELPAVFSESFRQKIDSAVVVSAPTSTGVLWTSAIKENPRNPEAHEAKRKAGWYSAVALWVFEVDSTEVINAVKSASEREPARVFGLAHQCTGQLARVKD